MVIGYTVFATAAGQCGIAWSHQSVVRVQLPEADAPRTRARLAARFPECADVPAPAFVQTALDSIIALLNGEMSDLSSIPIDLESVPPFERRVYEVVRAIPVGAVATYGEIAERIGAPSAVRAVGQALGRNPIPIIVPCHRVLAAGGKSGGFSARGGAATKRRLLALERTELVFDFDVTR